MENLDPVAELENLALMAGLLVRSGQSQPGLRPAGAVEAQRERLGIHPAMFEGGFDPKTAEAAAMEAIGGRAAAIRESGRRMSLEEARAFALQDPGSEPPSAIRLTRREVEVARLVRAGLSDAQIARQLFISPRTAESHVQGLRGKLGVSNRTEVALWAADNLPEAAGEKADTWR